MADWYAGTYSRRVERKYHGRGRIGPPCREPHPAPVGELRSVGCAPPLPTSLASQPHQRVTNSRPLCGRPWPRIAAGVGVRSTIREKHDRWQRFAARTEHLVRYAGEVPGTGTLNSGVRVGAASPLESSGGGARGIRAPRVSQHRELPAVGERAPHPLDRSEAEAPNPPRAQDELHRKDRKDK